MRKIGMLILVCVVTVFSTAFVLLNASSAAASHSSQRIVWKNYSQSIFEQAKNEHRQVLILGKAEWCHWCQKMEMTTWNNPAVIQLVNKSYIPVKVDIDADAATANQYNIGGTPTVLILNDDGHVIQTIYGYRTADGLLQEVNH